MSKMDDVKLSRRAVLKRAAVVPLAAVAASLAFSAPAEAATKSSKASMMYQDKPKGGDKCSMCMHFVPGASASAMGTCKVVQGAISPNGWCAAFAKK